MNTLACPTETRPLTAGLDYYKPTMSQLAYEQEPDAVVTFTFKNRGQQRLLDYLRIDDLADSFATIAERGWTDDELDYISSLRTSGDEPVFTTSYLDALRGQPLPPVEISYDEETDDIAISTEGPWYMATFWETVVMSEVNEAYFEAYLSQNGLDPTALYDIGEQRLSDKIARLQSRPDVQFSDFGTRRHFSYKWQQHVVERLRAECPNNFIGTSNVGLAEALDAKPIGTFAHEMPMVYAGLAAARGLDIRGSHQRFLQAWYDRYGNDLSIALTDTFTTDFFFEDFSREQAQNWRGVRHDSGDPFAFGERLLAFYEANGINPLDKTVVFSDGLNIETIVALQDHFGGRINTLYGWGTTLTNDLGVKALNIVMKATHVRLPDGSQADTVKLSDNPGKHTGPTELVTDYQTIFANNA